MPATVYYREGPTATCRSQVPNLPIMAGGSLSHRMRLLEPFVRVIRSRYPKFQASGSKLHLWHGIWDSRPLRLCTCTHLDKGSSNPPVQNPPLRSTKARLTQIQTFRNTSLKGAKTSQLKLTSWASQYYFARNPLVSKPARRLFKGGTLCIRGKCSVQAQQRSNGIPRKACSQRDGKSIRGLLPEFPKD